LKTKSKQELSKQWGPGGLENKIQTVIIKAVGPQRPWNQNPSRCYQSSGASEAVKTECKQELSRQWGSKGLGNKMQADIIKAVGPQRP
jgi:hypothetical protein